MSTVHMWSEVLQGNHKDKGPGAVMSVVRSRQRASHHTGPSKGSR